MASAEQPAVADRLGDRVAAVPGRLRGPVPGRTGGAGGDRAGGRGAPLDYPGAAQGEERLLAAAAGRVAEQVGVYLHAAVREALAAHASIGADQEAMVRDICQGGAGVAVVVGKPGTGKTFALGVARHAWQLDGYRIMGAAPTGIATVCLGAEGLEPQDVATVDRLLGELDISASGRNHGRGRRADQAGARHPGAHRDGDGPVLDTRTVLVGDEAGMLGSRKLARLLDHAQAVGAKVVLVGDDRQLSGKDRLSPGPIWGGSTSS